MGATPEGMLSLMTTGAYFSPDMARWLLGLEGAQ